MSDPELLVPARYCGPPDSGNGGWVCGSLAALADPGTGTGTGRRWPSIEVTLTAPPPLDVALRTSRETPEGPLTLCAGETAVAAARPGATDPDPVPPVSPAVARAAAAAFSGAGHPFPTCFVCGPDRAEGDGLRIFPGPSGDGPADARRVAATWTPDRSDADDTAGRASLPATWAALDCAGGWAGGIGERVMVLGRMTARIDRLPALDEEHVVVGEVRGHEGRKTFAATSLYAASGTLVGCAAQTWIELR
ncbi:hypothetical protein [Nocardioides pantholopis]|uniref:hypothetical protein n=1 Tax=Nocardioides pantholopis TaxID=2483798 RepID=UPI000FDB58E8|nr:hypothetical protein [Nocardioides pantholopis]